MNSTYVRFVSIRPTSIQHPAYGYINTTFFRDLKYEEGDVLYIGRVIVDIHSSYVSIDLEDLSRLGVTIKSISIENDGSVGLGL